MPYVSIEELNENLTFMGWKQVDGPKSTINSVGEKYAEIGHSFPARDPDVSTLKVLACSKLSEDIHRMLQDHPPEKYAIEWRVRPECRVSDYPLVVEYRPDGPDRDFLFDRPCVKDHNFKLVQSYARISFVPIKDEKTLAKPAEAA